MDIHLYTPDWWLFLLCSLQVLMSIICADKLKYLKIQFQIFIEVSISFDSHYDKQLKKQCRATFVNKLKCIWDTFPILPYEIYFDHIIFLIIYLEDMFATYLIFNMVNFVCCSKKVCKKDKIYLHNSEKTLLLFVIGKKISCFPIEKDGIQKHFFGFGYEKVSCQRYKRVQIIPKILKENP